MKKILFFSTSLLLTLFLTRLFLHFSPDTNIYILSRNIHHFYVGVTLLLLLLPFLLFSSKIKPFFLILSGIASALILDEYIFLLFTNAQDPSYFSPTSLYGTLLLTAFFLGYTFLAFEINKNHF